MRALKLTGQVVALAAVAGLLAVLAWRITHRSKPPTVGGPAPNFVASRLDGGGTVDGGAGTDIYRCVGDGSDVSVDLAAGTIRVMSANCGTAEAAAKSLNGRIIAFQPINSGLVAGRK